MDLNDKKKIIKNFVINISKPLELNENLKLIENILNDIKKLKLEESDYGYLWRGIFYSIWYTEMGKGCEKIILKLCELSNAKLIIYGLDAMNKDWFNIDYIRIDKYMFLTRHLTNKLIDLQFKQFIKSSKLKNAKSNAVIKNPNLLKNALNKMDGVGLIDHFLDVLFTECFKIISPFLDNKKHTKLICEFLNLINKTLINKSSKLTTDPRIYGILKIEFNNLFSHLKRFKLILTNTITNLIELCELSSSKRMHLIGSNLKNRLGKYLEYNSDKPDILPLKAKLTYNRRKALKTKNLKLIKKKRERRVKELKEERMKQLEINKWISPEEQFNNLVGI